MFHFFKVIFDTSFRRWRPFLLNKTDLCKNGKRDSGTKFTSLEFCLSFAQAVNRPVCSSKGGNQPMSPSVCYISSDFISDKNLMKQ